MSRFVRTSKYRHVFGTSSKLEDSYANLKLSKNPWDSNYVAANSKFLAVCWQTGGGGAAAIIPLSQTGKFNEVALFNGHTAPVLDVAFNPFNEHLFATASEDCSVKIWEIPACGPKGETSVPVQELRGHGRKVGSVNFNPIANNILATSAIDFKLKIWDIERGKEISSLEDAHTANIQNVEWNYDGSKVCTFCKDKKLRIIDPRGMQVVSSVEAHAGIKGGRATWLGQKELIFSAGFNKTSERRLAIWDPRNLEIPLIEQSIDNAAGIVMPFWDDSSSVLFMAGKGDGSIRYYEVVNDDKVIYFLSAYSSSTPQQGVCALPKYAVDVNTNEIMRLFKATATQIEPISFKVPRRSDGFQTDLFPDAPAPVPALSSSEWASGKNSAPKLQSMAPGFQKAAAPQAEFKPVTQVAAPVKTEAQLRVEYDQLVGRIAYLEAEVTKKDAIIKSLQ